MDITAPYLLFLGDAPDQLAAKTAEGVHQWRPEKCVGQLRLPGCQADLGLPDMSPAEAAARGARTLLVGVANAGGRIGPAWGQSFHDSIAAGLDIANGLHTRLSSVPGLADAARAGGRRLIEARQPAPDLPVAKGTPRPGKRILTVGTDCSVGKMYTALALEKEMTARGLKADFRATGQTGIFIAGGGVPVDAVVADFIAGSVEQLCPAAAPDHWDLIEGQGSLHHPSYAGVSLGLLHGAQAQALILCHAPGRAHMRGVPGYPLPSLAESIALNEGCARLTCPRARVMGLAFNTSRLTEGEARALLDEAAAAHNLPATDPLRFGVAALVDHLTRA